MTGAPMPYGELVGNLPDRCESITQSIIDNFKMQESEDKGSPISPTDNHIATLMFMLSHYIADAHMPLHCDKRKFSDGSDIHAKIEGEWDKLIQSTFKIDKENQRFLYNSSGFPEEKVTVKPLVISWVEEEIITRKFSKDYGTGNKNTWDFLSAITQYSYFTAYQLIPKQYDETNLDWNTFKSITGDKFDEFSKYILADAIDTISRVWLRLWIRYDKWLNKVED